MAKKRTPAQLKKALDTIFSLYVRKGATFCYTCQKRSDSLQCGHFVSRQYLATRWEPDNCRPQCWGCNGYGRGQLLDFEERLKNELGDVRVEELKSMRHKILKLSPTWYEEQIAMYKELVSLS